LEPDKTFFERHNFPIEFQILEESSSTFILLKSHEERHYLHLNGISLDQNELSKQKQLPKWVVKAKTT